MGKGLKRMSSLITTIVTTYKRPQLLKRAINSVLNQTFSNLQVCVFDNASNDETAAIMQELMQQDKRINYFCHPTNIGMAANYDYALSTVNTNYFSLLSDDDVLLPHFYDEVLKGFKGHPEVAFSAASSLTMDQQGKIYNSPMLGWRKEGYYSVPEGLLEMTGKFIHPTTILFDKKIISEAKPDWNNLIAWDSDYLMQLAAKFPFCVSKRISGIFLYHPESYTVAQSLTKSKEIETLEKWSNAYCRILQRLKSNENIDHQIYLQAEQQMNQYFHGISTRFALNFMAKKRFDDASGAIKIYQAFNQEKDKLKGVSSLSTVFKSIPGSDKLLTGLRALFLGVKRMRSAIKIRSQLRRSQLTKRQLLHALKLDKHPH